MLTECGAVVQSVRIPACHAGGRGFESRPLRHYLESPVERLGFFSFQAPRNTTVTTKGVTASPTCHMASICHHGSHGFPGHSSTCIRSRGRGNCSLNRLGCSMNEEVMKLCHSGGLRCSAFCLRQWMLVSVLVARSRPRVHARLLVPEGEAIQAATQGHGVSARLG